MYVKYSTISILIFLYQFLNIFCSESDKLEGLITVSNETPLYSNGNFVEFENLFNVELVSDKYEVSYLANIVVDSNDYIYALDFAKSTVLVFDDKGSYLRTMGNPGQGPQDLHQPLNLKIFENNLYILEDPSFVKIWDKEGEYIDRMFIPVGQVDRIESTQDNFIFLTWRSSDRPDFIENSIVKTSKKLQNLEKLYSYEKSLKDEYWLNIRYLLATDQKNHIYFFEDYNTYSIIKFDINGEPLFKFGRRYNRKPFSAQARSFFTENFRDAIAAGFTNELTEYPPVIRNIFFDSKEYLWVVAGEIKEDSDVEEFPSTIDLFDENGKWLYSFESTLVSHESIIVDNRLYSISKHNPITGQQYIRVYQIQYNY